MEKCPVCRKDFTDNDEVQPIPPPLRVLRGQKSGTLGLYQHEGYPPTDHYLTHLDHCAMQFFDPEGNPNLYDQITDEIRDKIWDEVKDEVREEFQEKFERVMVLVGEENYEFCCECWDEVDKEGEDPENQICLWCKRDDMVWNRWDDISRRWIYFCARCQKYWDEEEEEIAA